MQEPSERAIVNSIVRHLKTRPGCWYMKTVGSRMGRAGVPDLVICLHGRFLGLEVKRPSEHHPVSALQRHELQAIHNARGIAKVVHSLDEARHLLDAYDHYAGAPERWPGPREEQAWS